MRKLMLFVLLTSLFLSPQPTFAQGGDEAWMLEQLNVLRAQNGRGALTWNGLLAAAAAAHSQVLATTPWVGPHIEANGSTPQSRAAAQGYGGRVGENVVGGGSATVQWAWNWWMNSPTHVTNMLGDWNEVGIAVAVGSTGRFYTMVFGNNGSGAPPPVAPPPGDGGASSDSAQNGNTGTQAQQVAVQRPTRPPPPTPTPSITLTPSITFTPRATYTGMPSITPIGPTDTPIVMELAPIEVEVMDTSAPLSSPTPEPLLTESPPSATPQAVAALPITSAADSASDAEPIAAVESAGAPVSSAGLRGLLPIIIGLQFVLVAGLVVRTVFRRSRR